MALSADRVNFGEVQPEDTPKETVEVRNAGDEPLRIERVGSSCGCTTARLEPSVLAPGEATPLEIALSLADYGSDHVRTRITLVTNDPERPEATVEVSADIVPEFTLEPGELDFGRVKGGREAVRTLEVKPAKGRRIRVTRVEASERFEVRREEPDSGEEAYRITVRVPPELRTGLHQGRVAVVTDVARMARRAVPVRVEVVGLEVQATPNVLVFGPAAPGALAGTAEISAPAAFEVTGVTCPTDLLRVAVREVEEGRRYALDFAVDPGAASGDCQGQVTVNLTDGILSETVSIPFFGTVAPE